MNNRAKKIKNAIFIVALVIVVVAVCLFVVVSVINKNKNRPTFVFGYSVLWVETGSMEPLIPSRSFILVKKSNGQNLNGGDVITFICNDSSSPVFGSMVTHRIIKTTAQGYKTCGDNGNIDLWTVAPQDVVAEYTKNLTFLTYVGRVFLSPIGLLLIILLFVCSCAFIYVPDLIKACRSDEKLQSVKEKEIEKRVKAEVLKMQERDRKGREE